MASCCRGFGRDRSRCSGWRPRGPELVAASASAIESVGARRVRALGSVAMTLCLVAAGQLDAMLSLRPIRSVDAAAAQLLVREAGGAVLFPAADELSLEMRSPVLAARDEELLERLRTTFAGQRRSTVLLRAPLRCLSQHARPRLAPPRSGH